MLQRSNGVLVLVLFTENHQVVHESRFETLANEGCYFLHILEKGHRLHCSNCILQAPFSMAKDFVYFQQFGLHNCQPGFTFEYEGCGMLDKVIIVGTNKGRVSVHIMIMHVVPNTPIDASLYILPQSCTIEQTDNPCFPYIDGYLGIGSVFNLGMLVVTVLFCPMQDFSLFSAELRNNRQMTTTDIIISDCTKPIVGEGFERFGQGLYCTTSLKHPSCI